MTPIGSGTVLAIALLLATSASRPDERRSGAPATTIAIEHVAVIPMDAERVLGDQTVLVENGVITSVTAARAAVVPANAQRVDGRGAFLVPGFVDAHVHLYDTDGFPSYLRYGVTTVVNMSGDERTIRWRDAVRAGSIVGPTIVTAGPTIDGDPAGSSTFASVDDSADARREIERERQQGYDFIKVYSGLRPDIHRVLLREAARRGLSAFGHAPMQVGIDSVLASGQANIAHVEEFFQNPVSDSHFPALVRAAKSGGVTVTANLVAYSDYLRSIADLSAVLADPEMRFASAAALGEKLPSNNRSIRPNPAQFAEMLRSRQLRFRVLVKMLNDAGVPILDGTDTEIFGLPGRSAHQELEELTAAGLSPYDALRAATAAPGAFLGRVLHAPVPFGQVRPGFRGDLVLLGANPLVDIKNAALVRGIVLRGVWLPRAALDHMRDSVAAATGAAKREARLFDSLANAGHVRAAVESAERFHAREPGATPFAESVLSRYALRAAGRGDAAGALAVRTLATTLYPRSATSHRELARLLLGAGDTTAARAALARAIALGPAHAWASTAALRIDERGRTPLFVVPGVTRFDPVTIGATRERHELVLRVVGAPGRYHAYVRLDSVEAAADDFLAAGSHEWIGASFPQGQLALKLAIAGADATGAVTLGYASSSLVRGRRSEAAPTR